MSKNAKTKGETAKNDNLPKLEWHTEQRQIKELIPYDKNPRKLSYEKRAALHRSIEKFNFVEIPVINLDNVLIAGHQRLTVMMALGRGDETTDVRVPNRMLTDAELKEYNVQSNVSIGDWDLDILKMDFGDLNFSSMGLDFNFDLKIEKVPVKIEDKQIKSYKRTHVLLSFSPDKILDLQKHLDAILKIEGVEYEQSSN